MSIRIERNTGWMGMGSKIQIRVDGEKIASVSENQYVQVELPGDKAHLKVTQFGVKSNEIEVKDGDIVKIMSKRWYRMSVPLLISIMIFTNLILDLKYRLIVIVLYIISSYLIDGFYLEVSNR